MIPMAEPGEIELGRPSLPCSTSVLPRLEDDKADEGTEVVALGEGSLQGTSSGTFSLVELGAREKKTWSDCAFCRVSSSRRD